MDFKDNGIQKKPIQEYRVQENPIQESRIQENTQYFEYREVQPVTVPPANIKKKVNAEFVLGAVLLGSVGGIFILAALVMLGMNFMNDFLKGMCAYAGALILWGVSEFLIYRKLPRLGKAFSTLGMLGIYAVTIWNCCSLKNFGMWIAIPIALLTTIVVIVLSRKRDSLLYRVIGIIAWHISILPIQFGLTQVDAIILTVIVFVVNLLYIFVPIHEHRVGLYSLQMFVAAIYILIAVVFTADASVLVEDTMLLSVMLTAQIAYIAGAFYKKKELAFGRPCGNVGIIVSYIVVNTVCFWALDVEANKWIQHYVVLALVIIHGIAMLLLRKVKEKWVPYYLVLCFSFIIYGILGEDVTAAICAFVCILVSKLVSWWNSSQLKVFDAVITTIYCLFMLVASNLDKYPYFALLILGAIVSILLTKQWQTYHETILVFALALIAIIKLPPILELQAFVGILFVSLLAFNSIERWRGKNIIVFNILAFVGEIICFLLLLVPIYRSAQIIYFCMFVFGVATIVLVFQESCHMDFNGKNLILAIFLSYMAFVVKTNLPVINSVLLMVIAFLCVGIGFCIKEKKVRIYGLVLSLLVCGKIVLYDYIGANIIQKTILLLAIGVIALVISGIYIILEIKNKKAIQ